MTEKLKLFEITFNKLSADKSYMAYYLRHLAKSENKTQAEIIALLNCSTEDYYKLALCQAPELSAADFMPRIRKIANYSNTSDILLANIIDHATAKKQIAEKTQLSLWSESWAIFKRLMPFPNWLYQPVLTTLVIILFVIPVFSEGRETKNIQRYIVDYIQYKDSIKYISLRDNTLRRINTHSFDLN